MGSPKNQNKLNTFLFYNHIKAKPHINSLHLSARHVGSTQDHLSYSKRLLKTWRICPIGSGLLYLIAAALKGDYFTVLAYPKFLAFLLQLGCTFYQMPLKGILYTARLQLLSMTPSVLRVQLSLSLRLHQ